MPAAGGRRLPCQSARRLRIGKARRTDASVRHVESEARARTHVSDVVLWMGPTKVVGTGSRPPRGRSRRRRKAARSSNLGDGEAEPGRPATSTICVEGIHRLMRSDRRLSPSTSAPRRNWCRSTSWPTDRHRRLSGKQGTDAAPRPRPRRRAAAATRTTGSLRDGLGWEPSVALRDVPGAHLIGRRSPKTRWKDDVQRPADTCPVAASVLARRAAKRLRPPPACRPVGPLAAGWRRPVAEVWRVARDGWTGSVTSSASETWACFSLIQQVVAERAVGALTEGRVPVAELRAAYLLLARRPRLPRSLQRLGATTSSRSSLPGQQPACPTLSEP